MDEALVAVARGGRGGCGELCENNVDSLLTVVATSEEFKVAVAKVLGSLRTRATVNAGKMKFPGC